MPVTLTRIQLVEPRDRAQALIERYDAELKELLPPGTDLFDAHLHLGHDIDGMVGDYDQLEALMAKYGLSRAFMFCLDEADHHPAFSAANNRTLEFAARSEGRLIPFVRLDLNETPIEEATPLPRPGRPRDQAPSRGRRSSPPPTSGSARCSSSPPSGACRS